MKIIHLTGYFPPHLGGMEIRTKELSENFNRMGYEVTVITSDIGAKTGKLKSKKNFSIQYLKSIEFAHTPIMFGTIWKLLRLPNDAIIHLHVSQAILPEITYAVSKIRHIPYIAHIHLDVEASGFFGRLLPMYKQIFLRPVLRNAGAITVLTKDYKRLIREKYRIPADKITVIPNGTYFKTTRRRSNLLHKPIRLLFVGRLSVQKNIPLLLQAFAICVHTYKLPVHLTIAGDGEKKGEIENLIKKLQLGDNVTLAGNIPFSQIQHLYQQSDIFVLPSRSESFGSVLIEAMASGTPVIATNIPAVRNIIIHNKSGLLVKQNPTDMAKAIKRVIGEPGLRKALREHAIRTVQQYSWDTVTKAYETVYRTAFQSIKR